MNAIEIYSLKKKFGDKFALDGLNMTVPQGAVYGLIGENGCGKSTTQKLICGLLVPDGGSIKLFGKDYTEPSVRAEIGALIEEAGCYPDYSIFNNLKLQAVNLGLSGAAREIVKVLRAVRMEGAAGNKYKNCSLGMKQRAGVAMALLGEPKLLILDEPINGLDADGVRIVREIITDITKKGCTVLISSHVLGELEKIATHYGIMRGGKMIAEMTAEELNADCPSYVFIKTDQTARAADFLRGEYARAEIVGDGIRVYGAVKTDEVVGRLYRECKIAVSEARAAKINLEEYYTNLMRGGR